jgi:hypothetical protein
LVYLHKKVKPYKYQRICIICITLSYLYTSNYKKCDYGISPCPRNQIYADLAYRLGRIVVQYEKIVVGEEKFEATLYLAVLQNLMTNCNEYVRHMTSSERRDSDFKKDIELVGWGLAKKCWIKNTFNEEQNLQNFITRMRNSVSHPTEIDYESVYPSTGYTTILDDSNIIKKFRFINSPDTSNNRLKIFQTENEIRGNINCNKNEFPVDITYVSEENMNGLQYFLISDSHEFARISIIDLTVSELGSFVKYLANYLAQPIQENWDGITIKDLIAA